MRPFVLLEFGQMPMTEAAIKTIFKNNLIQM